MEPANGVTGRSGGQFWAVSVQCRCLPVPCSSRSSPCASPHPWDCWRRFTCPNMLTEMCGRWLSRCWRFSPAFRRWCTGFSPPSQWRPHFREWGEALGLSVASESALAAGMVMGIMIIPFVSSLSDDVISAVPQAMREGSYGLGATRSETIKKVIFPAALPGIVGGLLLAVSRAIGETMIVVMAAGLAANLTANPLEGGDDRNRSDRHPSGRRPGVRQSQRPLRHSPWVWCFSA